MSRLAFITGDCQLAKLGSAGPEAGPRWRPSTTAISDRDHESRGAGRAKRSKLAFSVMNARCGTLTDSDHGYRAPCVTGASMRSASEPAQYLARAPSSGWYDIIRNPGRICNASTWCPWVTAHQSGKSDLLLRAPPRQVVHRPSVASCPASKAVLHLASGYNAWYVICY